MFCWEQWGKIGLAAIAAAVGPSALLATTENSKRPPVVMTHRDCNFTDFLNCDVAKEFSKSLQKRDWDSLSRYLERDARVSYRSPFTEKLVMKGMDGLTKSSDLLTAQFGQFKPDRCLFMGDLERGEKYVLLCILRSTAAKDESGAGADAQLAISSSAQHKTIDYVGLSFSAPLVEK